MFIIINRYPIVTLNGAFTGRHFGAAGVGNITFYGLTATA